MDIRTKRVYDEVGEEDGQRLLVDRLWPRGLTKERAQLDGWLRDVAPSHDLRRRFHGGGGAWADFCVAYGAELDAHPDVVDDLLARAGRGRMTLLFASHDPEQNNAVALQRYLLAKVRERL